MLYCKDMIFNIVEVLRFFNEKLWISQNTDGPLRNGRFFQLTKLKIYFKYDTRDNIRTVKQGDFDTMRAKSNFSKSKCISTQ
jgi:hypothetical protein